MGGGRRGAHRGELLLAVEKRETTVPDALVGVEDRGLGDHALDATHAAICLYGQTGGTTPHHTTPLASLTELRTPSFSDVAGAGRS